MSSTISRVQNYWLGPVGWTNTSLDPSKVTQELDLVLARGKTSAEASANSRKKFFMAPIDGSKRFCRATSR